MAKPYVEDEIVDCRFDDSDEECNAQNLPIQPKFVVKAKVTNAKCKRPKKSNGKKPNSMAKAVPSAKEAAAVCSIVVHEEFAESMQIRTELDAQLTDAMRASRSSLYPNFIENYPMTPKNLIGFLSCSGNDGDGQSTRKLDQEVVLVLKAVDFVKYAYNTINNERVTFEDIGQADLQELLSTIYNARQGNVCVTALILNIDTYTKEAKRYQAACVRSQLASKKVALTKGHYPLLSACKVMLTERQMSKAIMRCSMDTGASFYFVNGVADLVEHLLGTYKAICEREQRKYVAAKLAIFSFLPEGELASGVRVNPTTGSGYGKLWKQVLEQCFGRSFPEGAEAIAKKYGCLQSLLSAYEELSDPKERANMLANIAVETKLGFKRRLGEVYSRKVYTSFTCKDGDVVVQ